MPILSSSARMMTRCVRSPGEPAAMPSPDSTYSMSSQAVMPSTCSYQRRLTAMSRTISVVRLTMLRMRGESVKSGSGP